jgi:hypothetical protein
MSQKTVTINGTVYDAHTGLPIGAQAQSQSAPAGQHHPSQSVHRGAQKSQTLARRHVQKSANPAAARPEVQKSPMVTKFAPHPAGIKQGNRTISDIGPIAHPIAAKAQQQHARQQQAPAKTALKPSQMIKQEAIKEAMDKAPSHHQAGKQRKSGKKLGRFASIGSISLALILLAGYFTYLNMPSLSVRVAAASAGVDASYPEYRPDGYSLSGSVAYNQGWVSMKFASNSGNRNFTVKQSKSSWDSTAVLDNYVKEKAGDNYIPYNERGLTIYVFNSNAAWVNDGILYTIDGDAPLSSDQIRRLATSM